MASFDSGVASYITGSAIVRNYFPVDERGNQTVNCVNCFYFSESSKRCLLNNEKPAYPHKYVGDSCPLKPDDAFMEEIRELCEPGGGPEDD